MSDRNSVALVTGANRGIGLGWVRRLMTRERPVLAICRERSPELSALGVEILDGLDITSAEASTAIAQTLAERRISMLVHNAGLFVKDRLGELDARRLRQQWEVNALAPLLLTQALQDRFAPGARVILMSSNLASIAQSTGGHYGYRMSKAALNMVGRTLAKDLAPRDVVVLVLSPGRVRTAMSGYRGDADVDEAAEQLLVLASQASAADAGRFLERDGAHLPW